MRCPPTQFFALLGLSTELSAILVAAITALATTLAVAPIRLLVEKRLQRSKVEIEYEYEQRKALRAEIAMYHGRLLEAALDLNYRLVSVGSKWQEGWLDVGGAYRAPRSAQYYFRTTAYRFIRLAGLAHRFEQEAIFVDARIADEADQAFVRYTKAFRWVVTDAALFAEMDYDSSETSDHFFTEQLRQMCAIAWGQAEEIDYTSFEALVTGGEEVDELLIFLDGIHPGQLRWDRLLSLQLFLMAFINTFGYDFQQSDAGWFDHTLGQIRNREVVQALRLWIPKLGLGADAGTKELLAAVDRRLA